MVASTSPACPPCLHPPSNMAHLPPLGRSANHPSCRHCLLLDTCCNCHSSPLAAMERRPLESQGPGTPTGIHGDLSCKRLLTSSVGSSRGTGQATGYGGKGSDQPVMVQSRCTAPGRRAEVGKQRPGHTFSREGWGASATECPLRRQQEVLPGTHPGPSSLASESPWVRRRASFPWEAES